MGFSQRDQNGHTPLERGSLTSFRNCWKANMTGGFRVSEELVEMRLEQCVGPKNERLGFP